MKRILLLIFLVFASAKTFAQTLEAQLLEINYYGDSYPKHITDGNGKIYFSAIIDSGADRELWVHNPGTMQTIKIDTSVENVNSYIEDGNFTMVGNILYFTRAISSNENILLRSDGTGEGTYVVASMSLNSWEDAAIRNLTSYNGKLYFTAFDEVNGNEIWVSDGTGQGTHLLKDINPGTAGSNIDRLFVFNGNLYFTATTAGSGTELWKTDGSTQGTQIFKDIYTGQGAGILTGGDVIQFSNHFYFLANSQDNGTELWVSDGSAQGTVLLKEFVAGPEGIAAEFKGVAVSGYFTFAINVLGTGQLWKSDGTASGTVLLKSINVATDGYMMFSQFTSLNDIPYFVGEDYFSGSRLFKTNGTVQGTEMVVNMADVTSGNIWKLTAANDFLVFSSGTYNTYNNLWKTNGTAAGTEPVSALSLSFSSAGELNFLPVGSTIYFPASSGNVNGVEFWSTDGFGANTRMIKDISHRYSGLLTNGGIKSSVTLNNKLIIVGDNGVSGQEPYVSDGTLEGTTIIKDVIPGDLGSVGFTNESNENIFTQAGNKLYFNGRDGVHGREIFSTDGTTGQTMLVRDIAPGTASSVSGYTYFMVYNDIFYFKANDNVHGNELWRTDGTEAGTYMVKDIYTGSESGLTGSNSYTYGVKNYAVYNGQLYFIANDGTGMSVWRTNGTEAGTIKVITLLSDQGLNNGVSILGATNNTLFLASQYVYTSYGANTIWGSNGTQEGTTMLDYYPVTGISLFKASCVFNNELYYNAWDDNGGYSIFKSDGTPAGTTFVKGNLVGDYDSVSFMQPCGNYLYFGIGNIYDSDYSGKLWRTDGTTAGTLLLAESNLDGDNSASTGFTCYNEHLLYVRPGSEQNVWITDGSVANTTAVDVIVTNGPQFEGFYNVRGIAGIANGKIFFDGNTAEGGNELYSATIEGVLGLGNSGGSNDLLVNNLLIYPNPANDVVTVSMVNNNLISNIQVFDFLGKKVFETNDVAAVISVPVRHLAKGIYLVKVKTGNETVTKKLMCN